MFVLFKGCGNSVLVYGEEGKIPGNLSGSCRMSQSPKLKSIDLPAYARKVGGILCSVERAGYYVSLITTI